MAVFIIIGSLVLMTLLALWLSDRAEKKAIREMKRLQQILTARILQSKGVFNHPNQKNPPRPSRPSSTSRCSPSSGSILTHGDSSFVFVDTSSSYSDSGGGYSGGDCGGGDGGGGCD